MIIQPRLPAAAVSRHLILRIYVYLLKRLIAIKDWLQNFGKRAIEPNLDHFPVLL